MTETTFELNVSLPHDARLAEMVRDLAVQAAQCAGCGAAEAAAFGRTVETMIREHLEETGADASLPVVVRRTAGPVEVLVEGRCAAIDA